MSTMSLRCSAPVAVLLLAELFAPAVEGQGRELFGAVEPAAARAAEVETRSPASGAFADDITLRSRVVTMDLAMLAGARASAAAGTTAPATLMLNLFDDLVLTGIVDRTEPTFSGGYAVSGRIAGEPFGTMTVVVNGETVAGTVRTSGGTYRIRSAGERLYAISEIDLSKFPMEDDVLPPPDADPGSARPR